MKNISVFISENFQFLDVKISIYLNSRVFVMGSDKGHDRKEKQKVKQKKSVCFFSFLYDVVVHLYKTYT